MSIFNAIGKAAQVILNPMGAVIDLAGDALGLPDGVKNVAKVGLGAVTGNFVSVAEGAVGLVSGALKGGAAKTEYRPPGGTAPGGKAVAGYAPSAAGVANPDAKLRDAVSTLQIYFNEVDKAGGNVFDLGLLSKGDLINAAKGGKVSSEVQKAARYLMDHPATRDLVDSAKNGKVDGKISRTDLELVLRKLDQQRPTAGGNQLLPVQGNGPCYKVDHTRRGDGPAAPAPAPKKGDGHCGPVDRKPQGRCDSANPKPAADSRCSDKPKSSGCGAPDSFKSILNNPNLSTEEKIQAVLAQLADGADEEILDVMDQMSELSSRKGGMSKEDAAKADSSMEQLQLRLQKLTERRKQMFELMSNISQKYNEMSNHAIQNLGKA